MAFKIKTPAQSLGGSTGETVRTAGREAFDRKAMTDVPSATGGAPQMNKDPFRVQGMTPTVNPNPVPKQSVNAPNPAEAAFWRSREALDGSPFTPFLLRTQKPLDQYNIENADFVNHAASVIENLATQHPAWQGRVNIAGDARQLALRLIAQWSRAHEPDAVSLGLPDIIQRSRETQQVGDILDYISKQRRA
jgi:hypothetical protein